MAEKQYYIQIGNVFYTKEAWDSISADRPTNNQPAWDDWEPTRYKPQPRNNPLLPKYWADKAKRDAFDVTPNWQQQTLLNQARAVKQANALAQSIANGTWQRPNNPLEYTIADTLANIDNSAWINQLLYYQFLLQYTEEERVILIENIYFDRTIQPSDKKDTIERALDAAKTFITENRFNETGYNQAMLPPLSGRIPIQPPIRRPLKRIPRNIVLTTRSERHKVLKVRTNPMQVGRVAQGGIAGLVAIIAMELIARPGEMMIDGITLASFATLQLARLEEIPIAYEKLPATIKRPQDTTTVQTNPKKDELTITRTGNSTYRHTSTDFRLDKTLRPYTSNITTPYVAYVKIPEPLIAPGLMAEIPAMSLNVKFINGTLAATLTRRTNVSRKRPEENKKRKDLKNKSQKAYMAALSLATRTFGRATEVLDFIDAIQNNIQVKIGGFWYSYGSFTMSKKLDPNVIKALNRGDFVVDFEQVLADMFVNELIDQVIGRLKRRELQELRNSKFWMNSFGNPSTWINRIT